MAEPTDIAKALNALLDDFDTRYFALVAALAGVGILSMAMLQGLKAFPVLRIYHRRRYEGWLEERVREAFFGYKRLAEVEQSAKDDTYALALGGNKRVLYGLSIEKFCGQLNVATQSVMDAPSRHIPFLMVLAGQSAPRDLMLFLSASGTEAIEDIKRFDDWLNEVETADDSASSVQAGSRWGEVMKHDAILERLSSSADFGTEQVDARNRIAAQIQRNIDYMMLGFGGDWKIANQVASVVLSIGIILLALSAYEPSAIDTPVEVATWLAIAILGGMIAPVARDLLASLQSLRNRAR